MTKTTKSLSILFIQFGQQVQLHCEMLTFMSLDISVILSDVAVTYLVNTLKICAHPLKIIDRIKTILLIKG